VTLEDVLLAMGDDELLLGHRDSEWCGQAPILEEDIAFANLALDEIGHAAIWYTLLAGLRGANPDTYPDELVYRRPALEFRNVQMVELPRRDWAFSMLRQYLFDSAEMARLAGLSSSSYPPLAGAAEKIIKEEQYHLRHSRAWVQRLGLGSDESHARLQTALNELWPYTRQLWAAHEWAAHEWAAHEWAAHPEEEELVTAGVLPASASLQDAWEAQVLPLLESCGLSLPVLEGPVPLRSEHTPHLALLVDEMQSVARLEPGAGW
jgi:ring-1,2-phenylacetyl-CoA epoxidase subunit PaaC